MKSALATSISRISRDDITKPIYSKISPISSLFSGQQFSRMGCQYEDRTAPLIFHHFFLLFHKMHSRNPSPKIKLFTPFRQHLTGNSFPSRICSIGINALIGLYLISINFAFHSTSLYYIYISFSLREEDLIPLHPIKKAFDLRPNHDLSVLCWEDEHSGKSMPARAEGPYYLTFEWHLKASSPAV